MTSVELTSPRVTVIIVNYNGGPLLAECVRSVLDSTIPVEVRVSDNASSDASLIELRLSAGQDARLKILENPSNLGFARANNVALVGAKGDYILFLNPDCILHPGTLDNMCRLFEQDPAVGMAGCLIRNPDGSEQPGCRRSIPTPWRTFVQITGLYRLQRWSPGFQSYLHAGHPLPESPEEIEAISGAFMLVRRQALESVGPMDEGYFMHFEDLDWCLRFRQAGWKVLFEPRVEIVHIGGVCTASRPIGVEYRKHLGMARFYRKFFRQHNYLLMYLGLMPGILLRFVLRILLHLMARIGFYPAREPRLEAKAIALAYQRQRPPVPVRTRPGAQRVVVTGATSLIGDYLLPLLVGAGHEVHAISRRPPDYGRSSGLIWHHADISREMPEVIRAADVLIHLAPLASLPGIMEAAGNACPRRVIGFGTTSLFTKAASALEEERQLVEGLRDAETRIARLAEIEGIDWTVFRPTLVYHLGRDKNVTTIALFLRKFGFFPLVGGSRGRRQPVHAEDLARATLSVIDQPKSFGKAYNLSGGEILSYRDMVERIARLLEVDVRLVDIPLPLLKTIILLVAHVPRFRHLNTEMATRISADMCFENGDAVRDFGFRPRSFLEAAGSQAGRPA